MIAHTAPVDPSCPSTGEAVAVTGEQSHGAHAQVRSRDVCMSCLGIRYSYDKLEGLIIKIL